MLNSAELTAFQTYIYRYSDHFGRAHLPWRQTSNPYHILVSEIMLQQTQVDRVIPKFENFLTHFPDFETLAKAPSSAVTRHWQGLGYNRRGMNLQRAAQTVVTDFAGQLPSELTELLSLPGIGPYTAAAIQAFAFNLPSIVIETNIRTVFIHHFFPESYTVTDQELLPLISQTLDSRNPRHWYGALMDYGTHLKQVLPNPTRRSKQYVKQSPLKGSNREVRGKILKAVSQRPVTLTELYHDVNVSSSRIGPALVQLETEGFVSLIDGVVTLRD